MASAVEDGNVRIGRDAEHGGLRLEADMPVKAGREVAHLPVHDDDGRALVHTDDAAKPSVDADDIPGPEPEPAT